jgi:hypothetical protein
MTEAQFNDLIELFAEKHPQIQHKLNNKKRFSSLGETVFASTASGLDTREFCVILCPEQYDTTTKDKSTMQFFDFLNVNLEVAKINKDKHNETIKQSIQNEAKNIIEAFWREILYYCYERIAPFSGQYKIQNITKNPTSGGAENLTGYRIQFTIEFQILGIDSDYQPFSL